MSMRKFSNISGALLLVFFCFVLYGGNGKTASKKEILTERIEKEKGEVSYSVKVSKQELEVIKTISYNALLKHKKLLLLKNASMFFKSHCFVFDYECRRVYNMSIVYLESELMDSQKEIDEITGLFEESHDRLKKLEEKLVHLEEGVEFDTVSTVYKSAIPELQKTFTCKSFQGWNSNRGVFISSALNTELPVQVFVKDVIKMENSSAFVIIVEAGDHSINFAYVRNVLVKKGDIVPSGRKLFTGSAGNPVIPDSALVFIIKKGKFINPSFICK